MAGSALGSLVVKLALEYAEYTQGLSKADQEAKKFAKSVQDAADSAQRRTSDFFGGLVKGAAGAVAVKPAQAASTACEMAVRT